MDGEFFSIFFFLSFFYFVYFLDTLLKGLKAPLHRLTAVVQNAELEGIKEG